MREQRAESRGPRAQGQGTGISGQGTKDRGQESGDRKQGTASRDSVSLTSALRPLTSSRGFTLVELLVVISIIGVLAGLITVAAIAVLDTAARTKVLAGINQVDISLKDYKNGYGAYPPNASDTGAMLRHFKRAFPNINPQELEVVEALAGNNSGTGVSLANLTPLTAPTGLTPSAPTSAMNGAEAIIFFLGGFSSDPEFPISGPGGPWESISNRDGKMEFDSTMLSDPASARRLIYNISIPGSPPVQKTIVLQKFVPSGLNQPYVYFNTSRGTVTPAIPATAEAAFFPVYVTSENTIVRAFMRPATGGGLEFVNPKSFQVLHAGTDDEWGGVVGSPGWNSSGNYVGLQFGGSPIGEPPLYPNGPFFGEMADNLSSFSTKTLEDSQKD